MRNGPEPRTGTRRATARARARSSSEIGGNSVSAAAITSISASVHVRRGCFPDVRSAIVHSIELVERAALSSPGGSHPDQAPHTFAHGKYDRNDQAPRQSSDNDTAHLAVMLPLSEIEIGVTLVFEQLNEIEKREAVLALAAAIREWVPVKPRRWRRQRTRPFIQWRRCRGPFEAALNTIVYGYRPLVQPRTTTPPPATHVGRHEAQKKRRELDEFSPRCEPPKDLAGSRAGVRTSLGPRATRTRSFASRRRSETRQGLSGASLRMTEEGVRCRVSRAHFSGLRVVPAGGFSPRRSRHPPTPAVTRPPPAPSLRRQASRGCCSGFNRRPLAPLPAHHHPFHPPAPSTATGSLTGTGWYNRTHFTRRSSTSSTRSSHSPSAPGTATTSPATGTRPRVPKT